MAGLGTKRKKRSGQKRIQKIKENINKEKDPVTRRELKKGNDVKITEDSMDY